MYTTPVSGPSLGVLSTRAPLAPFTSCPTPTTWFRDKRITPLRGSSTQLVTVLILILCVIVTCGPHITQSIFNV